MNINVRTRSDKLTDRDRTAAGGRWMQLGCVWKAVPMEVYDNYLNVYSSNVHAGKCSGTVKAPCFCTNVPVSNNHSDTNRFHSAYGAFWPRRVGPNGALINVGESFAKLEHSK